MGEPGISVMSIYMDIWYYILFLTAVEHFKDNLMTYILAMHTQRPNLSFGSFWAHGDLSPPQIYSL